MAHDDVVHWEHFPRYWPFVRGIHRSPVNSPHKGQWRRALMFSLICGWANDWINNRDAGDLRRCRAHYDVTVMLTLGQLRHTVWSWKGGSKYISFTLDQLLQSNHVAWGQVFNINRADSRFVPSQWETALLCTDVSHWLGANLELALIKRIRGWFHGFTNLDSVSKNLV